MKKLVYLSNARLPTEKAHGFQICKMCEAFAEHGFEVHLLHPFRCQTSSGLRGQNVFEYYGIAPVFHVWTLPNWDVFRLERFLPGSVFMPLFFIHTFLWGLFSAWVARQKKAYFYYTREISTAFWLVKLGLPTVYESHVVPRRSQYWLLRHIANHPKLQLVVVLTTFIKERLLKMGFSTRKVIVLPDSVDLSLFETPLNKQECRRRLGLLYHRPIIGYIGRFRAMNMEKGIPELIKAMTHIPSINDVEPLLLCVGGPMDSVPYYQELADSNGLSSQSLQFVNHVPNYEVPYWIWACDVATIPWPWTEFSAYFTSPLKLFEYMAAGIPIVATDLPSIGEILKHKDNAWLVKAGNPLALAEGIKIVLSDSLIAKKIAGRAQRDVKSYTWHSRTATILKSLQLKV